MKQDVKELDENINDKEKIRDTIDLNKKNDNARCNKALGIFIKLPMELKANVMGFINSGPLTYTACEDKKAINIACLLKRSFLRKGS